MAHDLSHGYGPEGLPRVVVLSFDNLGEASALERGTWSPTVPLGRDPSVTQALPRLLQQLRTHALTATFFVEAINCEHNPAAVREIAGRGHELGVHGWRHEPWATLAPDAERALLARARTAFARLGLRVAAFRPPGGEPTAHTARLLAELGYGWWSPAAAPDHADSIDGRPVRIPFDWELVDAYHLMDRFAQLRRARGDPSAPCAPAAVADRLAACLERERHDIQTVILHPFLTLDPDWAAGVDRLLALLASLQRERRAWVVSGGVLAAWLKEARA